MRNLPWALAAAALAVSAAARADVPKPPRPTPRPDGPVVVPREPPQAQPPADVPVPELPQGEVLARLRGRLKASASTLFEGWPAEKAVDGDPKTSWFSASGDAAALKTTPWLEVALPEDVTVQNVTALGNREPRWPVNYSIVVARIELYDAAGKLLASQGNETAVPAFDIEFRFKKPVPKVRRLRFVSLVDQGDKNPYRDIAIGELRAW